jgi:hypothetical protein
MAITVGASETKVLPDIYGMDEFRAPHASPLNYIVDVPVAIICGVFILILFAVLVPLAIVRSVCDRVGSDQDDIHFVDKTGVSPPARERSVLRVR